VQSVSPSYWTSIFPYFVRERMIRYLIVFSFQSEGQPSRVYIGQVYRAAGFLQYAAGEQQLVDRIVINFHLCILAYAAFLDKSRSLKTYPVVGLIEKYSITKERKRVDESLQLSSSSRDGPRGMRPVLLRYDQGQRRVRRQEAGLVANLAILGTTVPRRWRCRKKGQKPEGHQAPGLSS